MSLPTLLCWMALAGCGGSDPESPVMAAPLAAAADRHTALALAKPEVSTLPASVVALRTLADAPGDANAALRAVGPTHLCREGFVAPPDLQLTTASALPPDRGVFFSAAERASWRQRISAGPFVNDGDFAPASPGDWARISGNARRFVDFGDPLRRGDDAARSTHGQLARDAAFVHLMTPEAALLTAVRRYLLQQAAEPNNDFAGTRCYRYLDDSTRDGWFAEAPWLLRYIATYDFVRAALPTADRLPIENYIRRNAWFFAAHLDWGLRDLFPQRLQGRYGVRGADAASSGEAAWVRRAVDSNGDCRIDGRDDATLYPAHAYVRSDGSLGPRVPVLALWFNNRRAANAAAAAAAGALLGDAELLTRAKRYTMEWLSYGVFADGSSGEYQRNGEYCVSRQGLIYTSMSLQGAMLTASVLLRHGDRSLVDFRTREGLHGTEAGAGAAAKSIALVAQTTLQAALGELAWHQAEPQRGMQAPRAQTALGRSELHYMGGTSAVDDMHELSLLPYAAVAPGVPIATSLLRHPLLQRVPAADAPRRPVATGLGDWSDAWGILPAAYLLRPDSTGPTHIGSQPPDAITRR